MTCPSTLHLEFSGPLCLDSSAGARHQIAAAFAAGVSDLVIDLADVTDVDPHGLGVLAGAARHLEGREGTLRLVGAAPWLATKLRVNDLGHLIASAPPRLRVLKGDAQGTTPPKGSGLSLAGR